jgi:hypothetical protein
MSSAGTRSQALSWTARIPCLIVSSAMQLAQTTPSLQARFPLAYWYSLSGPDLSFMDQVSCSRFRVIHWPDLGRSSPWLLGFSVLHPLFSYSTPSSAVAISWNRAVLPTFRMPNGYRQGVTHRACVRVSSGGSILVTPRWRTSHMKASDRCEGPVCDLTRPYSFPLDSLVYRDMENDRLWRGFR